MESLIRLPLVTLLVVIAECGSLCTVSLTFISYRYCQVFTWHGASLEVEGVPEAIYVADEVRVRRIKVRVRHSSSFGSHSGSITGH